MAESASRYRAFISYSHADRAWADWLHKALETYRVPSRLVGTRTAAGVVPRRLAPVFRDRDELATAADLGARVNEALQHSDSLVVICSPRAACSRWVNEEVLAYKRLGREERIFCLIVGGEPNASDLPGRASEECFVPALRYHLGADGALGDRRAEPIAADARPGKDGRTNAKLKLLAGLLGVRFDTLKHREQHRRLRRMVAVTAVALVVMMVTTVLAIDALIERHHAVIAQQAAERRQRQAESLVRFMLGDLYDKLDQVGRLDIMQSVDDKAMAYFHSLPTADVTDQALAQRVQALQEIGEVRQSQGLLAKALQSYRSASSLAAELLRRDPAAASRQERYAETLTWIGKVFWFQGDLPRAAANFRAASEMLRKTAAARPADAQVTYQLSATSVNTGRVLEATGDFSGARTYYEAARDNYARLASREPANALWTLQLAYCYNDLGKLALEQGHLDQAIRDYRADQRLKAALAARHPNDRNVQEGLLISDAILGRTLGWCGDMEAAVRFTARAVTSARKLMAFDPTQKSWVDVFAVYSQQLGGLLRRQNRLGAAAVHDRRAVRLLSGLASSDPANAFWQQQLADARLEQSRLRLARNDIRGAAADAAGAGGALQGLLRKDPGDRGLILLAAQAELVLGRIAARRGESAVARQRWTRARDTIVPAARLGADPNFLAALAEALLRLGQTDAARPVLDRLNAMGYRTGLLVALARRSHIAYPVNAGFVERIARIMQPPGAPRAQAGPRAPSPTLEQ